ncbi:hypothetical protein L1F28_09575 [Arthrospira platensis NCB002]|uniref:hypothetical protein n=1 Tax=Limnospira platensis TaxID=118562 RepID=UPI0011D21AA4|nr:hypothetical protein [Arthrospira platensis NCB002]
MRSLSGKMRSHFREATGMHFRGDRRSHFRESLGRCLSSCVSLVIGYNAGICQGVDVLVS